MSNAIQTQGVTLEIAALDGNTFTQLAEITSMDGPSGSTNVIDVTNLSSSYAEKIAGLNDAGTVSLDMNLVPGDDSQRQLRTARDNREKRNFRITLTDAEKTTLEFTAIVTSFEIGISGDDKVTASSELTITGEVTWGNASA